MLILTVLRASLFAVSLTLLTMVDIGVPSQEYWADKNGAIWGALLLAFFSYLSGGLASRLIRQREAEAAYEYQSNIQAALSAGLIRLTEETSAPWRSIGVHAFRLRGFLWRRRLINVGGVRLGAKPRMDKPVWGKGKGVVGRAWRDEATIIVDWSDFYQFANQGGDASWKERQEEERYKLSWQELQHTAEYRIIMACPILDLSSNTIVGCISVDAPLSPTDLQKPEILVLLRDIAISVRRAGDPPPSWFQQRV